MRSTPSSSFPNASSTRGSSYRRQHPQALQQDVPRPATHLLHRLQAGQLCSVLAGTQLCFLEPQAKSPHSPHHLSRLSSEPALEGAGLSETHLRHRPPWPLASPGACPLHPLILPTLPPLYPHPRFQASPHTPQPRPQCFSVTSRAFPNSYPSPGRLRFNHAPPPYSVSTPLLCGRLYPGWTGW